MTLNQLLSRPELPSIPEALVKLNALVKHTRPIAEITAVIERDSGLAARSLEMANSAWYKRSRTISTVKDAITTIGLDTLHQLVFATSVIRTFEGINKDLTNMHSFWNQSLQLACNAKTIKESVGDKNSIHIFTSGVVTYIGKLIIYMSLAEQAQKILENSRNHPELQHTEEKKLLGFSHNEVSAGLLKKWDIPEAIYLPIQYYTAPSSAPTEHKPNASALYIAHQLVFSKTKTLSVDDESKDLKDALVELNLSQVQLPEIQAKADSEMKNAAVIVGLAAG
jgi:HD-like signal output (HDOD) protein